MAEATGTLEITASMARRMYDYTDIGHELPEADKAAVWVSMYDQIKAQGAGATGATIVVDTTALAEIVSWSSFEAEMASPYDFDTALECASYRRSMAALEKRARAALAVR